MLTQQIQSTIEQMIGQNNLVSAQDLATAKSEAMSSKKPLGQVLVEKKLITEEDLTKLVALASHIPYIDLSTLNIEQQTLNLIPKEDAQENMAVAFSLKNGRLSVAMVDPENLQAIDYLARKSGYPIDAYMASDAQITKVLQDYQPAIDSDVVSAIDSSQQEAVNDQPNMDVFGKGDSKKLETIVQDAPITRALNSIIEYAINSRASDIHIEPRESDIKVRFRIDGILQEIMTLPKSIEPALVSRIKILSKLKIDEHRMPQDGQAQYRMGNKEVDLRIAIAPISYGEQVVIRLLDKSDSLYKLASLGLRGRSYEIIKKGISKPNGMILSTGPTGSGKSTTLYAIIQEIITPKINIITLEDPVEYKINGVNQIQVNPEVGLTFTSGLRSILRQDPNVIMVGEIRDHETADLAVQSALTGHLVLSTLHTNSAAGVLPRMLDMKIEPYLIASTINTCIGQRLVRKICEDCKGTYEASEAAVRMINKIVGNILPKNQEEVKTLAQKLGYDNLPIYSEKAYTLYKGKGCEKCQDGYKGRTGLYEVFEMNPQIESLLLKHATTSAIASQAQADGMITMQQDGILKVLTSTTTLQEVARVATD